jgi:aminomethyltransferase
MMVTDTSLQQSPLQHEHRALKAKMVPFAGWEMPVQYEGILAEYWATRQAIAVFDTSHMGEFIVEGEAGSRALDNLVTQPLSDMAFNSCRYGLLLNEQGGVMDDLIVYRFSRDKWMVVVNAGTMEKDATQFERHITATGVFKNMSASLGKVDVQGPLARETLSPLVSGIARLEYYTFMETVLLGQKALVSRTGYTGELGFEIYFPWAQMPQLWNELMSRGVKPAGLGARDVLRTEMGYPPYGHELAEDKSPLPVGVNRFIDGKKEFIGKAALEKERVRGVSTKLICFASENRRSPRAGHQIFSLAGKPIGQVTSGTFSPFFQKGIGLGMVDIAGLGADKQIFFGEEPGSLRADVVSRPIYKNGSLKK